MGLKPIWLGSLQEEKRHTEGQTAGWQRQNLEWCVQSQGQPTAKRRQGTDWPWEPPLGVPPCWHLTAGLLACRAVKETITVALVKKDVETWHNRKYTTFTVWFKHHFLSHKRIHDSLGLVQFSWVAQSCLTLCDPVDCSTQGFAVLHCLPELAQTHVHLVGNAIQPSHPLSSPFPPAFNLSQHQGLFQWVSSSNQVAKLLELQLQHQSSQWIFRTDILYDGLVGSPCTPRYSQVFSNTTLQ